MRKASPLLSDETLKVGGAAQLALAKQATVSLFALFDNGAAVTFRAVLENVAASGLFEVPDTLVPFATPDDTGLAAEDFDEREASEAAGWREMLETNFRQIEAYDQYVTRVSPFGTHQGVKGLEFPRVMVIISDE